MMKNKAMRCVWLVCGLLMLAVTSCKDDLLYTDGEPIPGRRNHNNSTGGLPATGGGACGQIAYGG